MKKVVVFFLLFFFSNAVGQTLLLEENFDYSLGTLTVVGTNWAEDPIGSLDIQVVSGSLSFSNYSSSGIGNKTVIHGGASGRSGVIHSFTAQSANGSTVYFSFLLKVDSTNNMDTNISGGDYFANFNGTQIKNRIMVRQGSGSAKYSIGLAKTTSSTSTIWYSNELDVNTTYLIVTSYHFLTGNSNDEVRLWVNPVLTETEPTSDVSITSGADADALYQIQFRQNPKSGDMQVDGIRVATSWSQAPLPVELYFFKGFYLNGKIILNWRTETELNNYGFEVQRSVIRGQKSEVRWEKIGFVNGNGNSNSKKEYSFEDKISTAGKYFYRLKQIDFDGNFKYSGVIEVNIPVPADFSLNQNYPNPFNPATTISFNLPKQQYVTLEVFNILGQKIVTLLNEIRPAGTHTVNFDASSAGGGLNSGFYVYKLTTENFVQVKKMTLIK